MKNPYTPAPVQTRRWRVSHNHNSLHDLPGSADRPPDAAGKHDSGIIAAHLPFTASLGSTDRPPDAAGKHDSGIIAARLPFTASLGSADRSPDAAGKHDSGIITARLPFTASLGSADRPPDAAGKHESGMNAAGDTPRRVSTGVSDSDDDDGFPKSMAAKRCGPVDCYRRPHKTNGDHMLFQGKYRIKSARLPTWNYAGKGSYHVIINTKDRQRWFGNIRKGVLHLSLEGLIVATEWLKTPILRPYVELDEWIVMPDHFHAVVHINPEDEAFVARELPYYQSQPSDDPPIARLLANSLGAVLNQFKGKCTKEIREFVNPEFAWQPRFYDVIIRSQEQLDNARRYVRRNITTWDRTRHRPRR